MAEISVDSPPGENPLHLFGEKRAEVYDDDHFTC